MPIIKPESLILVIQLIEAEMNAVKAIPENKMTEGDEISFYECQRAAEDLRLAYAELEKDTLNYPPYSLLVPSSED